MRLRRSLKVVSVVDLDGNHLYDVDREQASDDLRNGRAMVQADGISIRMQRAAPGAPVNRLRCGSAECNKRWISESVGSKMARASSRAT